MTTALLEGPTTKLQAKRRQVIRPVAAPSRGWSVWPSVVLAILFHAGVACLILPGVPGSPLPAIAPLSQKFSSSSSSLELVDEVPAPPTRATPLPAEPKGEEPSVLQPPALSIPKKPLVAQQPLLRPAARPTRSPHHRPPALGGGLVLSEPPYPYEARCRRLQGKVTLQVFVREGRAAWVEVLKSSGHDQLDGSAKQWALHHWRFPGIASGSFTEAVIFSLDGV
ncbi:energy transducer TonB [Verrucomicrobium sp. 3C]|uniref:energy transducer TonB n=1 Tax=Verrucomicrobium sp. 3C TaxID=1134055 RepID=UPI00037303EF|nr:energy transducer TonB [Verrucomicrobium sp. 3C]